MCAAINMTKWETSVNTLRNLMEHFKFMVILAFNQLGLLKPSQPITGSLEEEQHPNNYILLMDRLCPSIVPVPIHVLTAHIKKRLPVVEFCQVLDKHAKHEDQETICNICLECIERSHEVRQQCNCDHVFHKECLDCWINQGQVTCPLCRTMLFPAKGEKSSNPGNPWTMGKDAYLDRLELIVG